MATFQLRGTVIEKPKYSVFTNGKPMIEILVREINNKFSNEYKVQFNGYMAKEIPTDIDLVGAEVFISGKIAGLTIPNKGNFIFLHGQQLRVLYVPKFSRDSEDEKTENIESEEIPF